ncbi:WbuC family cupin fold metalloprotein [Parachitinimonas caeni]|uniref:WbuC family cupin fold metalloprotein n=1 Tax=Parachitinimonas caeni TaxID=3031301 RepID=A0ABT7DYX7_9NEIS|nr:WbuC family cupin fold metalloprotein [Parachitinimonas caeni]MDK2125272.1 WbuC family cupin fold metalloprotein [Parachitinimonas caeni]
MSSVTRISAQLLDTVTAAAQSLPRRRRNHNFHNSDSAICHRLLNAVEPESYVAPHCHLDSTKDEMMVVLRGSIGIVIFDAEGVVIDTVVLSQNGPVYGVDLPPGTIHSLVSLESGSVILEAKAGPYLPLSDEEKMHWAPAENAPGWEVYRDRLIALFK